MEPMPYIVWYQGIRKWEEGAGQSAPDEAFAWWEKKGRKRCSFCRYYYNNTDGCGECPLATRHTEPATLMRKAGHDEWMLGIHTTTKCAEEWESIDVAYTTTVEATIEMLSLNIYTMSKERKEKEIEEKQTRKEFFLVFQKESRALLERIKALPHTEKE